jgi:hypothetical protein
MPHVGLIPRLPQFGQLGDEPSRLLDGGLDGVQPEAQPPGDARAGGVAVRSADIPGSERPAEG